jgi:8-oxo-dGTP pyrophosphatase MutT (NUDIX family)
MASDIEPKNPWKRKNSKLVYENPWIRVNHDEVIDPGGQDGIYGRVQFKHYAVGILAIDKQQNIYLVGQYRYAIDAYSWEIPEGGCQLNQDPLEAAKRELKEETGIVAKSWQVLQKLHASNSVTDELALIYLAQDLSFEEAEPESCEDLRLKKIKITEALAWVFDRKITDAISVCGIQAYTLLKHKIDL